MAVGSRLARAKSAIGAWLSGGFAVALVLASGGGSRAEDRATDLLATAPQLLKICTAQTYALCAVASCFVLDGVAHCKCDVKSGDSISLPFNYDRAKNVCTINAEGARNRYMISTFSLPGSVVAPNGDKALYDCPAASSNGAYAQCDGGVCFDSSEGQSFPGFATPLGKNEIICSCPITVADPATAMTGYQIAGPYPCQQPFFRNCNKAVANTHTGSRIYVGAPTGSARYLTRTLYGYVPPLNVCRPRLPPGWAE
jgi:hypothetical protein